MAGTLTSGFPGTYDFAWQMGYEVEEPIKVPKGTKMIVTAHHDNSANNKYNPDPTRPVQWGELTTQEMVIPWFGVIVDREIDPAKIAFYRPTPKTQGLLESTPALKQPPAIPVPTPSRTQGKLPDIRLPILPPRNPN